MEATLPRQGAAVVTAQRARSCVQDHRINGTDWPGMLNNFLGQFFNGWCAALFQQQIDSFENQMVQFGSFDMSDFAQLIVNGLFQVELHLTTALLPRSLPDRLL